MRVAKSKRVKQQINIPPGVDVEAGVKVYNQGWGHSLASVIHWLRDHYTEHFDPTAEALLVSYMKERWGKKMYRHSGERANG